MCVRFKLVAVTFKAKHSINLLVVVVWYAKHCLQMNFLNNSIGSLSNGVYGLNLPPWPSKPCTPVVRLISLTSCIIMNLWGPCAHPVLISFLFPVTIYLLDLVLSRNVSYFTFTFAVSELSNKESVSIHYCFVNHKLPVLCVCKKVMLCWDIGHWLHETYSSGWLTINNNYFFNRQ